MSNRWTAFVLILSLGVAWRAHPARAQDTGDHVTLEQATQMLASNDSATIRTGIESLGLLGSAHGVAPLSDRIREGLPPALLDEALDTLTALARPEAGPVLFELLTYRRPAVRKKAVAAIIACHPRGADRALMTALADTDPGVRSAAALGLGQLGAHDALDALFLALDRNVIEAATSIGQVVHPDEVPRLLGYIGRIPFDAITPGLSELLARHDIPNATKLQVIARLGELASHDAKDFLQQYGDSLPPHGADRIKRAVADAVARIAD